MSTISVPKNPLAEVELVLGGPMQAVRASGLTYARHYQIREKEGGTMKNARAAKALDEATAAKGHRVPMLELLALEPWRGPERCGGGPPKGGRPEETPTELADGIGCEVRNAAAVGGTTALLRPGRVVRSRTSSAQTASRRSAARRHVA